jgi:hypothetical protein
MPIETLGSPRHGSVGYCINLGKTWSLHLDEINREREREGERYRPSGLVVEDVAMASVSVSGRRG